MPYFGVSWAVILNLSNMNLTHTVNFGMGAAFSKGPDSAFSKGSGSSPLHKVCHERLTYK